MDDQGGVLSFRLTEGNVDDRKPVPSLLKSWTGKVFGDRGYISQALTDELAAKGISLITTLKSNIKVRTLSAMDQLLLRKRSIIETINDQLRNISQIEHSRHRSLTNYVIDVIAGLVAYTYQPKSPLSVWNIRA